MHDIMTEEVEKKERLPFEKGRNSRFYLSLFLTLFAAREGYTLLQHFSLLNLLSCLAFVVIGVLSWRNYFSCWYLWR